MLKYSAVMPIFINTSEKINTKKKKKWKKKCRKPVKWTILY